MSEVCDLCLSMIQQDEVDVCCECGYVFCSDCGDAPTMLCDECREAILKRAVAERDNAHALIGKLTRERDEARTEVKRQLDLLNKFVYEEDPDSIMQNRGL